MSTTEQRLAANRANALQSTGPRTTDGKAIASRNATRHGLLSAKLFLEDEDPEVFHALCADLTRSLNPVGALEFTLVERIAVTVWRQRRLIQSETAALTLARQPVPIAKGVTAELGRGFENAVKPDQFIPFDEECAQWCRGALAEIEGLEEIDLRSISKHAPLIYAQLQSDADEDTPEMFLASHPGGLTAYVGEVMQWCNRELREAAARPQLITIADQVRAKGVVLPAETLELLARYQTTLDNQLFKALKALREAQEWRLKSLEACTTPIADKASDVAEAA